MYTECIKLGWYAVEHDERITLHHFVYAEHERRKDFDPMEINQKNDCFYCVFILTASELRCYTSILAQFLKI